MIYFLSLLDPSKTRFDEDELTTLLQILFVWLIEKKYHSIYMNKMIKLLNILSEPRHSKTLINVLIKLNMVSLFHDLYFRVDLDGVYQRHFLADQLMLYIRVFVTKMGELLKTTKNKDLINVVSNMVTWMELRDDVK